MNTKINSDVIKTLCNYQPLSSRSGRDSWLMNNLSSKVRNVIVRRHDNCRTDLTFIFDAIGKLQLSDGQWPIVILIDALIVDTEDLKIGDELKSLRKELMKALEPSDNITYIPEFKEIVIGRDEKLPIKFMERGWQSSRSVARVEVKRTIGGVGYGTGWLIAPNLLLTNHHVIEARERKEGKISHQDFCTQAKGAVVRFDFNDNSENYVEFQSIELIDANEELDYALLSIGNESILTQNERKLLSDWGFLKVASSQPELIKGTNLNIIQHPGGRPKELAIRTNFYLNTTRKRHRLHYLSDTEGGSSGSPIFNDNWEVIGLHRAWVYYDDYYKGQPIKFNNLGLHYNTAEFSEQSVMQINEGVLIHSIIENIHDSIKQKISSAQGWH